MNRRKLELKERIRRLLVRFIIKLTNDLQINMDREYTIIIDEFVDLIFEITGGDNE